VAAGKAKRQSFFAVARGRVPGVYEKWGGHGGAQEQVDRVSGALYKKFASREEAEAFMSNPSTLAQTQDNGKEESVPGFRQPIPPNRSVYIKGLPDEVQDDPLGFLQLVFEDVPGLFNEATYQRSTRSPDIIFVKFRNLDQAMTFMREKPPRFVGSSVVANYTKVVLPRINSCLERFTRSRAAQGEQSSGGLNPSPLNEQAQIMEVEGEPEAQDTLSGKEGLSDASDHPHPVKHPYLDRDSKQEEILEELQDQPPPVRPRLDPDNQEKGGDKEEDPNTTPSL